MMERYNVDVLGVSEAGLPPEGREHLRETVSEQMKKVGLGCIWGRADPVQKNLGVMVVWRKGLSISEATWVGTDSGRMVGVELTTWNEAMSKEEKSLILVLYGFTGMTTQGEMPGEVVVYNQAVRKVVERGLEKYSGRVLGIGDLNSLADADMDGMGLVGGVVSEDSLVSVMLGAGLVDCFRELHPDMKAVSCSSSVGAYSRVDYMLAGCGVLCARVTYVVDMEGPRSDHVLMLADFGGFTTGAIYGRDDGVNIRELTDWEVVRAVPVPWRRFWHITKEMRKEQPGGGLSEEGEVMLEEFRVIMERSMGEGDVDVGDLFESLSREYESARAAMGAVGGSYDDWVAGGSEMQLQKCLDHCAPGLVKAVQGVMCDYMKGRGVGSERDRQKETAAVVRGLTLVGGHVVAIDKHFAGMEGGDIGVKIDGVGWQMGLCVDEVSALVAGGTEVGHLSREMHEMLLRGKLELEEALSSGVIGGHGVEVAADSLWTQSGRLEFIRKVYQARGELRRERRKEFLESRLRAYESGERGVWFRMARGGRRAAMNQMPVGEGGGVGGGQRALRGEYERMFAPDFWEDGDIYGPAGTKYEGMQLVQLKHLLYKEGRAVNLRSVDALRAHLGEKGFEGVVIERMCAALGGILGHLDYVRGGVDRAALEGRLSEEEQRVVLAGGSKHPGQDGIKRGVIRCFGGRCRSCIC